MPKKKTDRTKTSSSAQAFDADIKHVENSKEEKPAPTSKKEKPIGKYRDPNYKLVSVYLKKNTTNKAKGLLLGSDIDLSEKIEELLNDWFKKESKSS